VRRALAGAEPRGIAIVGFAGVSLLVNGLVLGVLAPFRHAAEPYLRATWIDTRADVLVNAGVLASGALVALTGARVIDLVAGALLAAFVMHEGWEILESAGDEASGAG
jgi:Co/Zn/Cd efflux system component